MSSRTAKRKKRNIPIPSFEASALLSSTNDDVNVTTNINANIDAKGVSESSNRSRGRTSKRQRNMNEKSGGSKTLNILNIEETAKANAAATNDNSNAKAPSNGVAIQVSGVSYLSSILKIETALQLQQRRSNGNGNACISIAMDKFIQIITRAMDVTGTHTMAMQLAAIYLIIAQPDALILIIPTPTQSSESSKLKIDFNIDQRIQQLTQSYSKHWKMQKLHLDHEQFKSTLQQVSQMCKLCKQKYDAKNHGKESNDILQTWMDTQKDDQPTQNVNGAARDVDTNANAQPSASSMTLEQRIRAREKAKQHAMQLIKSKTSSTKSSSSQNNKQHAHLLPLADAIHILLKRKHISSFTSSLSSSASSGTTKCTWKPMTLKDVCRQLSGSNFRNAQLNFRGMKRMNAKDVKNLIEELVQAVPEWIQIVDNNANSNKKGTSNNGNGNGNGTGIGLSRKDKKKSVKMVVIRNRMKYQSVREKLAGRIVRNAENSDDLDCDRRKVDNDASTIREMITPLKVVGRNETKGNESNHYNGSRDRHVPAIDDTIGKAARRNVVTEKNGMKPTKKQRSTSELVQMAQNQADVEPSRKPSKLSLSKRGNRIHIPGHASIMTDNLNANGSNVTQEAMKGAGSHHQHYSAFSGISDERYDSQTENGNHNDNGNLRVNYNQHMTDEDYDGGLTLQSNSTNPRGLRLMFGQLNAGKRI